MNYQKELDDLLNKIKISSQKPTLLLHACCGPCSSYVLEYLASFFQVTVFYYNPNIYPPAEYNRRLDELKNLYTKFPPVLQNKVRLVECDYDSDEFYDAIKIKEEPELAREKEKGERCRRCYEFRLKKAFEYAKSGHFDYFCTTLSISPFKDAQKINTIGLEIEKAFEADSAAHADSAVHIDSSGHADSYGIPKWLPSDFKKKGGFKRSLELSEEYNLYRQDYCGCIYSLKNTQEERNNKQKGTQNE